VEVAAGAETRVELRLPSGKHHAEWAWALKDHTISHKAEFIPGSSVQGGDSVMLADVDQHDAKYAGPSMRCACSGPGVVRLVFDNTFSRMRGKTVLLHVEPRDVLPPDLAQ
jgi:hypothetical protein